MPQVDIPTISSTGTPRILWKYSINTKIFTEQWIKLWESTQPKEDLKLKVRNTPLVQNLIDNVYHTHSQLRICF